MPKSQINYSFFSSFIIRTPSYPINFYLELTDAENIESNTIIEILKDEKIREAIFLASPDFYDEICKWTASADHHTKKANKIKLSILKYLIRMSTRCTPFGLFSASGSGTFATQSSINIIGDYNGFYRKTRLDMHFLGNLRNKYNSNSIVQNELRLFPNTTLYKLAKFYRYIQYSVHDKKRVYSLEGFKRTKYLDLILDNARAGIKREELTAILISKNINQIEAAKFIEQLIMHQILVYEAELILTGDDYCNELNDLVYSIKKSQNWGREEFSDQYKFEKEQTDKLILFLEKTSSELIDIDNESTAINRFISYEKITKRIAETRIPFDKKYLFHTDLFLKNNHFTLNEKYKKDIRNAILLLNKISERPKYSLLENFKKAFTERYDTEMVALVRALDVETGIGYIQDNNFDITPLLDSIGIKHNTAQDYKTNFGNVEKIILDKSQKSAGKDNNSIILEAVDFENVDFSNESLPSTFSCLFEVIEENGKEWISILNIGESSAANLSARFCYGNEQIAHYASEIIRYETDNDSDKIIAEIVHLPQNRTGNILRRPNFRFYEIPYLAQSGLPLSQQIDIEDIMLQFENGRLLMWSKKYKKQIIPRHTNAHNYSYNSLPIYQFLHDMQFEDCKASIGLSHHQIDKMTDYLPRIIVQNCIVSKEKWIFNKEKHPAFFEKIRAINTTYDRSIFNLESDFSNGTRPLPQYVSLVDGDNTLIVNLENRTCIEMLVNSIKDKSQFVLEEYLFPSTKLVTGSNEHYYGNQFIVGLKWERN